MTQCSEIRERGERGEQGERGGGSAHPTTDGFLEFANGILSFANDGKYVLCLS